MGVPRHSPDDAGVIPAEVPTPSPPVPNEAEYFEIGVAGGIVPVSMKYSALRDLRAAKSSGTEESTGILFGAFSHAARIDLCVPMEIAGDAQATDRGKLNAILSTLSERLGPLAGYGVTPIGLFRTQSGSWPAMSVDDCELLKQVLPQLPPRHGLFLLIRMFVHRPWSAALFVPDVNQPSSWRVPALEFPFDEYLLRNGYTADALVPRELPAPPEVRGSRKKYWLWGGIAGAVLLGGAALYTFPPGALSPGQRAERPVDLDAAASSSLPLSLKVDHAGKAYVVSWNRAAAIVQQATNGVLLIRDGSLQRPIQLDPSQLREGRVLFEPLSDGDVDFRLEVNSGTRTEAESVRVVGWSPTAPAIGSPAPWTTTVIPPLTTATAAARPALPGVPPAVPKSQPLPLGTQPQAGPATVPPTNRVDTAAKPAGPAQPAPAAPSPQAKSPIVDAGAAAAALTPRVPALGAPEAIRKAAERRPAGTPPATPVQTAAAPKEQSIPTPKEQPPAALKEEKIAAAASAVPPRAAEPEATAKPLAPVDARPAVPPKVDQPVATRRIAPALSDDVRAALRMVPANVTVFVRVSIDASGSVAGAQVDSVTSVAGKTTVAANVRMAAIAAARLWKFKPAMVNGKAVPAEQVIEFRFY